jgi:hypothetical protein
MNFDKNYVKTLLVRDKIFLRTLYTSDNLVKSRRILTIADDTQLDTLLHYLHFLANGLIKIKKHNFDVLENARKITYIKNKLETKSKFLKLLTQPRKNKLQFLTKLCPVMGNILYALFNEL